MKLRIGPELAAGLAIVKQLGFSVDEAVERAARRWERLDKPELSSEQPGSTYRGTVATVEPPEGMDGETVRRLLAWYFRQWPPTPPRPAFQTMLKEGRDYLVETVKDDEEDEEDEEDDDDE